MKSMALLATLLTLGVATRGAQAQQGPGKVRLVTGSAVFGVVQEVVPGDYVIILLPHGELRTIPWASVSLVSVRGYAPIGAAALPETTYFSQSKSAIPTSAGPADTGTSTPSPAVQPESMPSFALGLSGSVLSTTGRGPHGIGLGGEARLVSRLAPSFSLYALFEGARFDASHAGSIGATTWFVGGGARLSSNPTGTSALLDFASGWRSLSVDQDRSIVRHVAIPFRLGVGIGFATGARSRADLLVHVAPHVHPYRSVPTCDGGLCTPRTPTPTGFVSVSLGFDFDV